MTFAFMMDGAMVAVVVLTSHGRSGRLLVEAVAVAVA